jgi:hypothetical protein
LQAALQSEHIVGVNDSPPVKSESCWINELGMR